MLKRARLIAAHSEESPRCDLCFVCVMMLALHGTRHFWVSKQLNRIQ